MFQRNARGALVILCTLGSIQTASAASSADVDRMTTYAVIIGRAIACGAADDKSVSQAGAWFDRTFPPGTADNRTYLPVFFAGIAHNAKMQAEGRSPDNCATVSREYRKMQW